MEGDQKKRLREALLDAFPQSGDMEIVVADAGIGLAFVNFLAAPGTTYSLALLNLIDAVDAQGRVEDLLRTAAS